MGDLLLAGGAGLGDGGAALQLVAAGEEDAHDDEQDVEDDVEAEVGGEAVAVARPVGGLEDLGRGHVAGGPADEAHGQGGGLFGLCACTLSAMDYESEESGARTSGDVAGDQGEDQVTLREEELGAVEGDEEADAVALGGLEVVDDGSSDDSGERPDLELQLVS